MPAISSDYLRSQRDRPAVLKGELAKIRSRDRCALVFVLEGKDDLVVYDVWIRRLEPAIQWYPLVAHGKKNSLAFREMLNRDTTGLRQCTYFIVDHDYDGLRGQAPASDVYVLPAYSVENYLVDPSVVQSILRTDLHLLGDPEREERIISEYRKVLAQHSEHLVAGCATLYGAKSEPVGDVTIVDSALAGIDITVGGSVVSDAAKLSGLILTQVPVSAAGKASGLAFLRARSLEGWIRGKFLYDFFKKWVTALFEDRRSPMPVLFAANATGLAFTPASLDFRSLAAKSPLPAGMHEFLLAARRQCVEDCARSA